MSLDSLVLGTILGLTYGILAIGLVLIYKSNRFVNFAHGNLGALAAVVLAKLVVDVGVPYWVAVPLVLAGAAGLGALVELTVVRRLFEAPRLVLVVATIALSQLFLYLALQRWARADQETLVTEGYPVPFEASIQVGNVVLRAPHLAILVVVPLMVAALAAFFRFSPYGQAIRAASENPDAARLAGISVRRMSTIIWVIAALVAAITAILLAPTRSVFEIGTLGPSILVRALGAALIGRMVSLPVAFAAGIAIGIIESVTFATFTEGGITDLVVFVVVMVALTVRARELGRSVRDPHAGSVFGGDDRALPAELAASPGLRRLRRTAVTVAVAVAVALPVLPVLDLSSSATTFQLTVMVAFAIVGLSLVLLTGWAGQVSLGQFALVGVGAFAAARWADVLPVPLLLVAAGGLGALVAVIVGIPAVRIQGLFLAVSTLAFAVVASGWAFQQEVLVGDPSNVFMPRPGWLGSERAVYWFALAVLAAFVVMVRNLRRSGPGRMLVAVRDNDRASQSAGISVVGTRLLAFGLSGFMAGVAGVIFALARQNFTATQFDPATGLQLLLMVIIGGLGSISGALLGAVFLFGIPIVAGSSELVRLLTSAIGVLIVLLFLPGGLVGVVASARDAIARRIVRAEQGLPGPPRLVPPLGELWRVARGQEPAAQHQEPAAHEESLR
jgi:ABC-type branched-subunit amino acid transport system permease subunit